MSSKLEEVTQRSCRVSVFGDNQNPTRCGSKQSTQHDKQRSSMRWSPEASPYWLCDSLQPNLRLLERTPFQIFRADPHDAWYQINTAVVGFENNLPRKPYHPKKWPCKPKLSSGYQKLNGQLSLLGEKKKRENLTDWALPPLDRPYWSSVNSASHIEKIMHSSF